jgi:hypothetical protein
MTRHSPLSGLLLLGVLVGDAAGCKDPDPAFIFDGSASDGPQEAGADQGAARDAAADDRDAGEDAARDGGETDAAGDGPP